MVTQVSYNQTPILVQTMSMVEGPASQIKLDYESIKTHFKNQPPLIQRFFETQAAQIAPAIIDHQSQIRFSLPDRIVQASNTGGDLKTLTISEKDRQQVIGGLVERLAHNDIQQLLRQKLLELELSSKPGLALAARLIRYTIADFMVNRMLPSGRSITYIAMDGEDIPCIPVDDENTIASAITAKSDAVIGGDEEADERGELQVPYVLAARRFYLPQWVAFDEQNNLLVNSINEAQAHINSMQRYLEILHAAVDLAPYMLSDADYQHKRYGMLGQLVNQGRRLAVYMTQQTVVKINLRAKNQELNRGLSLSLPYFDDQALEIRMHNFDVIPGGRIMFIPGFVIRAARSERVKVAQDTRLSPSTRKHLLAELTSLENAFF